MSHRQATTFTTSPIYFDDVDQLEAFLESMKGIRVDALDFDYGENDDGNNDDNPLPGHPLAFRINKSNHSIVILSPGSLKYYDADKFDQSSGEEPELKNLLDTVFDFKMFQRNPNLEIIVHKRDLSGAESKETIKMSELHSKEAYEKRVDDEFRVIQQAKANLQEAHRHLEDLKAKHRQTHIILEKITNNDALDQAF